MPLPVCKTKLISLKKSSTGVFLTQHDTNFKSKQIKEAPNLFMRQYPSSTRFKLSFLNRRALLFWIMHPNTKLDGALSKREKKCY